MTELYPKLHDDKANFMLDKQKLLKDKLYHIEKIKQRWSTANTVLKIVGISVTCVLGGASILSVAPFSIPIAAAILSGVSLGNMAVSNLLVEGFTSRRKRYLKRKHDRIRGYLNKMEAWFIKCKEDGQISLEEFEQFQKLLKGFENESKTSLKTTLKTKDIKMAEKQAKKEVRQQQINMLLHKTIQEYQQKLK